MADALLAEDRPAAGRDRQHGEDDEHQRRKGRKQQQSTDDVERPLHGQIDRRTITGRMHKPIAPAKPGPDVGHRREIFIHTRHDKRRNTAARRRRSRRDPTLRQGSARRIVCSGNWSGSGRFVGNRHDELSHVGLEEQDFDDEAFKSKADAWSLRRTASARLPCT